jgi:hypothetical protein
MAAAVEVALNYLPQQVAALVPLTALLMQEAAAEAAV